MGVGRVQTGCGLCVSPHALQPRPQNGCCPRDTPVSLDLARLACICGPPFQRLPTTHCLRLPRTPESSTSSFYICLSDPAPPAPQLCHLGLCGLSLVPELCGDRGPHP